MKKILYQFYYTGLLYCSMIQCSQKIEKKLRSGKQTFSKEEIAKLQNQNYTLSNENRPLHIIVNETEAQKIVAIRGLQDLYTYNNYGHNPLHHACYRLNLGLVKFYIESGAHINSRTRTNSLNPEQKKNRI